jgi:hypothetical protein
MPPGITFMKLFKVIPGFSINWVTRKKEQTMNYMPLYIDENSWSERIFLSIFRLLKPGAPTIKLSPVHLNAYLFCI